MILTTQGIMIGTLAIIGATEVTSACVRFGINAYASYKVNKNMKQATKPTTTK